MVEYLVKTDKEWLLWLNDHHTPFFDRLMVTISGRAEWIPLYVALLALIIWRFRKQSAWIILIMVIMILLSDQAANLLKNGLQRPRPCRDPEIGHLVHLVNGYCGGAYGFVSGHAANSFALATFVTLLFRNIWLSVVMLTWAVMVSYSRIYLGVHYPGDILGGALLGIMAAWMIYYVWRHLPGRKSP